MPVPKSDPVRARVGCWSRNPENPYPKSASCLRTTCPRCDNPDAGCHPLGDSQYRMECPCGWVKTVTAEVRS